MNCLYSFWLDVSNPTAFTRTALLAYGLFYERLIDNESLIDELKRIHTIAKSISDTGIPPDPSEIQLDFNSPYRILEYLLTDFCLAVGHHDECPIFFRRIDRNARFFFERKYEEEVEWEDRSTYEMAELTRDFFDLIMAFVRFADHVGKADILLNLLCETSILAENIMIEYGDITDQIPDYKSEIPKNDRLSFEENMRLVALDSSYQLRSHYACASDPFLVRGASHTTTHVTFPSTYDMTIRDLINIRNSSEWKTLVEMFDAQHDKPAARNLHLDFTEQLRVLSKIMKSKRRSSLIGASLSLSSVIPGFGPLSSLATAIKDFFSYLRLGKTISVTRVDETDTCFEQNLAPSTNGILYRRSSDNDIFINVQSASALSGHSASTIRKWARTGQVRAVKQSGKWYIALMDLDAKLS